MRNIFSSVRSYASQHREEALERYPEKGTMGFAIPTEIESEAAHSRSPQFLKERSEKGARFQEVRFRRRYNKATDTVDVEAVIQRRDFRRVELLPFGLLPEKDARWMRALLAKDLPVSGFVAHMQATGAKAVHEGLSVTLAISRPDEAAREWIDIYDDRKAKTAHAREHGGETAVPAYIPDASGAGYAGTDWNRKIQKVDRQIGRLEIEANQRERQRLSCAKLNREIQQLKGQREHLRAKAERSRYQKAAEVTAEEFLRESTATREKCMTDLGSADYWQARHQM